MLYDDLQVITAQSYVTKILEEAFVLPIHKLKEAFDQKKSLIIKNPEKIISPIIISTRQCIRNLFILTHAAETQNPVLSELTKTVSILEIFYAALQSPKVKISRVVPVLLVRQEFLKFFNNSTSMGKVCLLQFYLIFIKSSCISRGEYRVDQAGWTMIFELSAERLLIELPKTFVTLEYEITFLDDVLAYCASKSARILTSLMASENWIKLLFFECQCHPLFTIDGYKSFKTQIINRLVEISTAARKNSLTLLSLGPNMLGLELRIIRRLMRAGISVNLVVIEARIYHDIHFSRFGNLYVLRKKAIENFTKSFSQTATCNVIGWFGSLAAYAGVLRKAKDPASVLSDESLCRMLIDEYSNSIPAATLTKKPQLLEYIINDLDVHSTKNHDSEVTISPTELSLLLNIIPEIILLVDIAPEADVITKIYKDLIKFFQEFAPDKLVCTRIFAANAREYKWSETFEGTLKQLQDKISEQQTSHSVMTPILRMGRWMGSFFSQTTSTATIAPPSPA